MNVRSSGMLRSAQLALYLFVELGWLYAWSATLGAWLDPSGAGPLLSLPLILALALLATLVTRQLLRHPGASRRRPVAIAALGLVAAGFVGLALLWSIRGSESWSDLLARWNETTLGFRVLGAMALAVVAWWRGIVAGRSRLTLDEVESGVRTATVLLAGLFALAALVANQTATPLASLIWATLTVIFAGLVGMPFARIVDLSASARTQGLPALGLNRHWLGMLLVTVAGILLLTIILALVFTFDRIDQLTRPLAGPAETLLWWIVYAIALPLGFLAEGLIDLFHLLFHPGQPPPPLQQPNVNWLDQLRAQSQQGAGPPVVLLLVAKWALIVLLAGIVLWLLARAVFRYADWLSRDDIAEDRDFVWSWSGVLAALRAWLRQMLSRPRLVTSWARPTGVGRERLPGEAQDPRALYCELLRLGARLGRGRAFSETPREYARALDDVPLLANGLSEIRTLTNVYVQARYSPDPPTNLQVAAAREALNRLQKLEEGVKGK